MNIKVFDSGIEQPLDKGILLKDILESGCVKKEKSHCIDANYYKGGSLKNFLEKKKKGLLLKQSEQRLMVNEGSVAIIDDAYKNRDKRIYTEKCPTLRSGRNELKVLKKVNPLEHKQNGNVYDVNNDKVPTVTCNKEEGLKTGCIQVGEADLNGNDSLKRVYSEDGKAPCLCGSSGGNQEPKVEIKTPLKGKTDKSLFFEQNIYNEKSKTRTLKVGGGSGNIPKVICENNQKPKLAIGAFRGRYLVDGKRQDGKMNTAGLTDQRLEVRTDEKSNTLTTVQKDNVLVMQQKAGAGTSCLERFIKNTKTENEKAQALTATMYKGMASNGCTNVVQNMYWRKLTPLECERLQTVKDLFTNLGIDEKGNEVKISDSQRYKLLGNGFTIDVIAHLFSYILKDRLTNI